MLPNICCMISTGPMADRLPVSVTLCLHSGIGAITRTFFWLPLCCAALYRHTGEEVNFLATALRVARYSAGRQRADGSWHYGEGDHQDWIDNFHTGYNLCALQSISRDAGTAEFYECMQRGFTFYRAHFFREDYAPRYLHNRTYPIDIHSVAQSIITLLAFPDLEGCNFAMARSVFQWAMNHMWSDKGYFYYRVLRLCTIRTSYMRWSQAWMLLAMSSLLSDHPVAAESLVKSTTFV